ncbi:hypothetical protein HETIRDRAFT_414346 [Heterobasidion irregulare TC 32-1]|uniref:Uncharacterized protein n=1 Tax=Heterobasidion irregulare (strain TC 32-1) TaxID=747525 RepID=W4KHI9_HETIT|nr:uncharacterized protein HETIRDRAFT_414346 [Heterobasidion irregulare TC 32-1]ETW85313.1 hypothetical protein HETIRDRAFT_414346 [Heterobasidion irregulare TC 32-1]
MIMSGARWCFLRSLEPSCIVVPDESATPVTPVAQGSGSPSITGEVAGQRSVAFVMLWRMVAVAKVQALTDGWCQSDIGDPQLYKASPLSPLSFPHTLFLPTTPLSSLMHFVTYYPLRALLHLHRYISSMPFATFPIEPRRALGY